MLQTRLDRYATEVELCVNVNINIVNNNNNNKIIDSAHQRQVAPFVGWWFLEKPLFVCLCLIQVCIAAGDKTLASKVERLTSETVKGSALSLQSVDNVKSSDSLSSGVLGVGDGISDDILKEDLKDTTGLFVDKTRDTLDATSSCQSSDGRLGDALDVISQDLSVTLGTTLS